MPATRSLLCETVIYEQYDYIGSFRVARWLSGRASDLRSSSRGFAIPQRTAITPPALEDEDLRENIYVSCRKLLRYRFFRDDFDERKTIAMRCVALRNPSVVMETRHNAMNRPIYSPFVVSATDRCNLLQGRLDHVFTQSVQQVAITVVQCIYYATTTG